MYFKLLNVSSHSKCLSNSKRSETSNFAEKEEKFRFSWYMEQTVSNLSYMDSGCSMHMCGDKYVFYCSDELFRTTAMFGDTYIILVLGKGNMSIQAKENTTHPISNI